MNTNEQAAATWVKSTRSNGQNNCVEVASLEGGHVALRDSKDKGTGPVLVLTAGEWRAFKGAVVADQF
jgi:Domain of unknown function (DUF397)